MSIRATLLSISLVILSAMTGHSVEQLIANVLDEGCFACLRKPFGVTDLIHTVARSRGRADRW